jgi:hypothetical protein
VRLNAAVATTASLLLLALTGCSAATVPPSPTPSPSPSPTPAASGPLTCDELVPADLVAATLEGADGVPVEPVVATHGGRVFDSVLLEGAGGLACSWRVGSGMPEYNAPSDWAYLTVQVLPGAAALWMPLWAGDAPSTHTQQVGDIEASVSSGDAGWGLSAPVGDAWVLATIAAAAHTSTGSRLDPLGGPAVIDRLTAVAESAFAEVEQADAARLAWPAVGLRQGDAVCNGPLDQAGIVAALGLPAESEVTYTAKDPTSTPPSTFGLAVQSAAHSFDCELQVDGSWQVTISTAHGFAPLFDRLQAPDGDLSFSTLELVDAPAGATALANAEDGRAAEAFVAVSDTLYRISGEGARVVAQAIVDQAD